MAGGGRLRAWGPALGGLAVVLAVLTARAGPYQYYEGTGVHDSTAAEVVGGWENVEGTRVVLRKDATALFEKLDGQDFDFEDGWRLSGTGTWQLTDDDGGQVVRLALTARTLVEMEIRSPATTTDTSTPEPPIDLRVVLPCGPRSARRVEADLLLRRSRHREQIRDDARDRVIAIR